MRKSTEAICCNRLLHFHTNICRYVSVQSGDRITRNARYIQDGSTPAIDNIYFDKQISNFGSKYAKISGVETADLTKVSGITGLNAAVGHSPKDNIHVLKD